MEGAINTLVQRLEAVTARLEKVEGQIVGGAGAAAGGAAPAGGAAAGSGAGAAWVGEFDSFFGENIPKLVEVTNKIGNDELKKQVAAFERALKSHRDFLNVASKCKKPDDATLGKLLEPTSTAVNEAISTRDSNRGNAMWNHLSAISEVMPALGWVVITPTPGPFANEYKGNSEFYSNKLLREYKGKDEDQVAWVMALKGFFTSLVAFIKQYHTTGLSWKNNGGEDASKYIGAAPAAASSAPAPPAAPGPPPPAVMNASSAKKGPDVNALFSEINKGTAISSGLKKVTSDMKTKNRDPKERSAVVKAAPKKAPARKKPVKRGTPKFALEGNKWVCEFQDDNKSMVIEETEPKHTVYLYKNDNCVVNVKGQKVNSICIDSCNKTGIVFNNCIAVVEVINCNGVEIQCQGRVPAFAIDKCSSIQVILSKECLEAEIVTSKSDQVNICIPGDDGDLMELAVPEQYKTTIKDNKLETGCVEHV
uniref:Adenylyl cyclase-associated protein n=1 Tax=Vannella robusta TaxID=1487602 RepID=A0A7S4M8K8_9EUKA